MKNKEKIKQEIKRHLVDSTAIASISLLTRPLIDTQILGISDDISINARLCGIATVYAGIGSLTKIRDISKKYFKLDQPGKEKYAGLHDASIAAVLTLGLGPAIYYLNGVTDIPTLACSTILGVATTAAIAIPYGWYIDTFRDLNGVQESTRKMPQIIKNSSQKIKKNLATILTAGFVAAAAGIYSMPNHNLKSKVHDYFSNNSNNTNRIENVQSSDYQKLENKVN